MSIRELRDELSRILRSFAWEEWAQMGVLASTDRRDTWAMDPEALLLLSLEVGRDDPRLFEEVLDWLRENERLISVQRLRNLSVDKADAALIEAALGWLTQQRPRGNRSTEGPRKMGRMAGPLFRGLSTPLNKPDPAFLLQGFLKESTEPSGNSVVPDLRAPINFAFRLRHLLGLGARAEAARVLLGYEPHAVSVQVVAKSTGYAKRNVQEALSGLRDAGLVDSWTVGNEQRFEAPRDRWARFLEVDKLPAHEDWLQLFQALRRVLRWLYEPENEELSAYMQDSRARTLIEEIEPDLRFAGARVATSSPGMSALGELVAWTRGALAPHSQRA